VKDAISSMLSPNVPEASTGPGVLCDVINAAAEFMVSAAAERA
jgi:hypothetical protein